MTAGPHPPLPADHEGHRLRAYPPQEIHEGGTVLLRAEPAEDGDTYAWGTSGGRLLDDPNRPEVRWDTTGMPPGSHWATVEVTRADGAQWTDRTDVAVRRPPSPDDTINVSVRMRRTERTASDDQAFWVAIRNSTNALDFNQYATFIDPIMCVDPQTVAQDPDRARHLGNLAGRRFLPYPDIDAYRLLKIATEVFMMARCGVRTDTGDPGRPFLGVDADEERPRLGDGEFGGTDDQFQRRIQARWRDYITARRPGERLPNEQDLATLPYLAVIRLKFPELPLRGGDEVDDEGLDPVGRACLGILRHKLTNPCLIELLWSYWHEEGMLVQSINTISRRFQNQRGPLEPDPLAQLEIDPLRPLGNLLWGYIQDEQHRLTVVRRAYEYDHHYGLTLVGKAVPELRPADSRSKFLEAYHHLLNLSAAFFKEDDDTTVIADGFPVLNALKEVHLLLTEGQHNQYGDLPWTARQEMLMQEWLLARPEMREFLPGRAMVAYREPWMDRVDAMKRLQGWTDVPVTHFRDLGVFGEQLLLSVRFGNWNQIIDQNQAANWARYWRPEIQGYIHAYRAVTGVDLTLERVDATMPWVHLRRRLAEQLSGRERGAGGGPAPVGARRRAKQLTRGQRTPIEGQRAPTRGQLPGTDR